MVVSCLYMSATATCRGCTSPSPFWEDCMNRKWPPVPGERADRVMLNEKKVQIIRKLNSSRTKSRES